MDYQFNWQDYGPDGPLGKWSPNFHRLTPKELTEFWKRHAYNIKACLDRRLV